MNDNTKVIADGLQQAIIANDAEAIAAGCSALSLSLGGIELLGMPWSASMQTLYLLALVIERSGSPTNGKVVNLHGLPLNAA